MTPLEGLTYILFFAVCGLIGAFIHLVIGRWKLKDQRR